MKRFEHLSVMVVCYALSVLLTGCDHKYLFLVVNQTGDTLRLEICKDDTPYKQQIYTIPPRRKELIFSEVERSFWNNTPKDKYEKYPEMILPPRSKVEIYKFEKLMPDSLRYRKHWEYKTFNQSGIYTLNITAELVE